MHIPFCARRCHYCAFATWTDRSHLTHRYLQAVEDDIRRTWEAEGLPVATSVFFGGGTPSLVEPAALMRLLQAIPRAPGTEVTVECNPDTVDSAMMHTYAEAGVSRVSLGVQSMDPATLERLGRQHLPENVERAVGAVRNAGLSTFNLDLIYGSVGEDLPSWHTTLQAALALDPPHVSAYALTVEAGTPLAADPRRHPDPDAQADMYFLACEVLSSAGLQSYEISNFARPGHECHHNLLYWSQGNYRGFGAAAHSHRDGHRWWNLRTPERYLAAVEEGTGTRAAGETLGGSDRERERLTLALRTRHGIAARHLNGLDELVGAGLVEVRNERAVLTMKGRMLGNEVALRIV